MKHSKKLKDFFIDEKVPKFERDKVLLFSDSNKILWVCGHRIDDRLAITSKTENILKIKLEKISQKKTRKAERIRKK
jgi:tRNA(Ile)-lysidine synthase